MQLTEHKKHPDLGAQSRGNRYKGENIHPSSPFTQGQSDFAEKIVRLRIGSTCALLRRLVYPSWPEKQGALASSVEELAPTRAPVEASPVIIQDVCKSAGRSLPGTR